jgi:hypothetical protein
MKLDRIEGNYNGQQVIIRAKELDLFGLFYKEVSYIATTEYPEGYFIWAKLPLRSPVDYETSLQLSRWCREWRKNL